MHKTSYYYTFSLDDQNNLLLVKRKANQLIAKSNEKNNSSCPICHNNFKIDSSEIALLDCV